MSNNEGSEQGSGVGVPVLLTRPETDRYSTATKFRRFLVTQALWPESGISHKREYGFEFDEAYEATARGVEAISHFLRLAPACFECLIDPVDEFRIAVLADRPVQFGRLRKQTTAACLMAVRVDDGWRLMQVREQTEEICLAAVQRFGCALSHVREQTRKICLAAVRQNGMALQYVTEQTEEICLAAVRRNGQALHYVKEQTEEICLAAVLQDDNALRYVKEQTPEICMAAVLSNPYYLLDVKEPTPELWEAAVAGMSGSRAAPDAVFTAVPESHLPETFKEAAIALNTMSLSRVRPQTLTLKRLALAQSGNAYDAIRHPTLEDKLWAMRSELQPTVRLFANAGILQDSYVLQFVAAVQSPTVFARESCGEVTPYSELTLLMAESSPASLAYLPNAPESAVLRAVELYPAMLSSVLMEYRTPAVILAAVTADPEQGKHVFEHEFTPEMHDILLAARVPEIRRKGLDKFVMASLATAGRADDRHHTRSFLPTYAEQFVTLIQCWPASGSLAAVEQIAVGELKRLARPQPRPLPSSSVCRLVTAPSNDDTSKPNNTE